MIKFYIPDGHLQDKTLELFKKAGFDIKFSERDYKPKIDDDEISLKRLRPQDFPFLLAINKGDLGIVGKDILTEFQLKHNDLKDNVVEILDLKFGKVKLVAAVSEDLLPNISTIDDFAKYAKEKKKNGEEVVVATEYPAIAENYLKKHNIECIIRKPYGKTEGWIIPPDNEADLIIDTTETGTTLKANRCKVIDEILESTARLIASKKSLDDENKKRKIDEISKLFKGVLDAEGKVNVYMNVLKKENLKNVLEVIKKFSKSPTISQLDNGGYDIFVVLKEKDLRNVLPKLIENGASDIVVSELRMIL